MADKVYIVDDEAHIRELASLGLKDAGFDTRAFADGQSLLQALRTTLPDALVLDWMMPPPDGLALCRMLRAEARTRAIPILLLTARSDEVDRVIGLEMGADDYIVKPFSVRELAARVRAVLRRSEYMQAGGDGEVLSAADITVDLARRKVMRAGQSIELTLKEFDLLVALMKSRGRVLTRDMLLDSVWGVEYFGDARTVDVHVRYLRQKIELQPDQPQLIQTVRGVGYRFFDEDEA